MAIKLFVGKLSYNTTDSGLLELFKPFGSVASAAVVMDKLTNRSRGFGFVEMDELKQAQAAIKELNGAEFEGQKIIVNTANPPRQVNNRTGRSGGYQRSW